MLQSVVQAPGGIVATKRAFKERLRDVFDALDLKKRYGLAVKYHLNTLGEELEINIADEAGSVIRRALMLHQPFSQ